MVLPHVALERAAPHLMELVGDISNDDVLAADASLEPLRNELANRKPEDCKKLWQQQQKAAVKDLEKRCF